MAHLIDHSMWWFMSSIQSVFIGRSVTSRSMPGAGCGAGDLGGWPFRTSIRVSPCSIDRGDQGIHQQGRLWILGKFNNDLAKIEKRSLDVLDEISLMSTSSTAQGGGGSFKNRKPIGDVGCCESRMAERIHWLTERWLELCLLEWLQWLQWSPHPQLLDVVWCTATVVVVVA